MQVCHVTLNRRFFLSLPKNIFFYRTPLSNCLWNKMHKISKIWLMSNYVNFSEYARAINIILVKNSPCHITALTTNPINQFSKHTRWFCRWRDMNCWKKLCFCYQLFALQNRNQAQFELSSEVFKVVWALSSHISLFITHKER